MSNLLELPSELLYQIIDLVLNSTHTLLFEGKRYRSEQLRSRSIICYPEADIIRSASLNLLLSSRRLRTETSLCLSKIPSIFELDLVFINDNWIWPTWKRHPFRKDAGLQEELIINFISCRTEDERGQSNPILLQETMIEVFKVVSQVLLHGPEAMVFNHDPKRKQCTYDTHLRFKKLEFRMNTTRFRNGSETFSELEIPFRRIDGLAHLDFQLLYPIDKVEYLIQITWLAHILKTARNRLTHGLVLNERIDKIIFSVDRQTIDCIEISEDAKNKRERDIAEYKQRAPQA